MKVLARDEVMNNVRYRKGLQVHPPTDEEVALYLLGIELWQFEQDAIARGIAGIYRVGSTVTLVYHHALKDVG